ncbi:hypothetical protein HDU90_002634 [Geranomyces variabilis]|nr:hypothetical protein HDU90_002634 [Geranomyces variabilis]
MGAIPMDLKDKVGLSLDEIIKGSKAQEKAERVHPDRRLGPRVVGWSQPAGYSHIKARPFANIKSRSSTTASIIISVPGEGFASQRQASITPSKDARTD